MHALDFAPRLALAFGFGALIGVERQWRQKLAGLRTNCLVSMGRQDRLLEQVATRLSREAGVTKIRWEVLDIAASEFAGNGLAVS